MIIHKECFCLTCKNVFNESESYAIATNWEEVYVCPRCKGTNLLYKDQVSEELLQFLAGIGPKSVQDEIHEGTSEECVMLTTLLKLLTSDSEEITRLHLENSQLCAKMELLEAELRCCNGRN